MSLYFNICRLSGSGRQFGFMILILTCEPYHSHRTVNTALWIFHFFGFGTSDLHLWIYHIWQIIMFMSLRFFENIHSSVALYPIDIKVRIMELSSETAAVATLRPWCNKITTHIQTRTLEWGMWLYLKRWLLSTAVKRCPPTIAVFTFSSFRLIILISLISATIIYHRNRLMITTHVCL